MLDHGFCKCGCGQRTKLAKKTRRGRGQIAGQPVDYIKGHNGRVVDIPHDPNPNGLCECGCGKPTSVIKETNQPRGDYAGHHRRRANGCQHRYTTPAVLVDSGTGCWNWLRAINKATGYGALTVNGRTISAHVYYYEQTRGPIPDGLMIDHLCRNHRCVNPDHLEAVTCAVNTRRGLAAKLTPKEVELIRQLLPHKRQRDIADQFGVSTTTVSAIATGASWS